MNYEQYCRRATDLLLRKPPGTGLVIGAGCNAIQNDGLVAIPAGEGWEDAFPVDFTAWGDGAPCGVTPEELEAAFANPEYLTFADTGSVAEVTTIELDGGKYTVTHKALRNGELWRDLAGDKLVLALCEEIELLKRANRVIGNDVRGIFQALVQEYGRRDSDSRSDQLLPAEDQAPAIRAAMAYLS